MGHEALLDLAKNTMLTALMIVTPALLVGMSVGLIVSFFQTVTSLQEQTLTIVPKMLAVMLLLLVLLAPTLRVLSEYTIRVLDRMVEFGLS